MSPPDLAWRPWTPRHLADRLAGVDIPWCVAGGWAIDLVVGTETRPHGDLEFAVLRRDYHVVREVLRDLTPYAAVSGQLHPLGVDDEPPEGYFQTWCCDDDAWRVDVMIEPGDDDTWMFRRDPSIQAPRAFMVERTPDGIPYLAPHGGLLYKAKYERSKDEADFAAAAPMLSPDGRAWLVDALARAHPDHPWLARLASAAR